MGVIPDDVRAFAAAVKTCVVGTQIPDGRMRQSVTYFVIDGENILVSTVKSRGKARDVERTGRASICIFGHAPPFPSVTVEGPARIVAEKAEAGELTRRISKVIFDLDDSKLPTDDAVAATGRVVLEITAERCYGASYIPPVPSADEGIGGRSVE